VIHCETVIRWEYKKDRGVDDGADCGWLDEVAWAPTFMVTLDGMGGLFDGGLGETALPVTETVDADVILMAVGRRPAVTGWGAETIGLDVTPKGITVDDRMRTNLPNVWAAGDVTGRSLLAHSAYRMAEVAVSDILAHSSDGFQPLTTKNNQRLEAVATMRMRYNAVPWAVYSLPEAAGVGMTEQDAERQGVAIKKASVPMVYSGRFGAENGFAAPGAVKVIAETETGRILGVHAVGAYASEFIWGGAALIEQEMRIQDVREIIFPHPTVGELIRDAVWMM